MQPQDEEARRRGHVGHELWRRAGELGFLCVDIPEEWGGAGGDFRHEAVLHEEMARRALSGMSIGVHSIAEPRAIRGDLFARAARGNYPDVNALHMITAGADQGRFAERARSSVMHIARGPQRKKRPRPIQSGRA